MNNQFVSAEDNKHCCYKKCFSWSSVFVGAFVGVGLSFLLNLFSIAIGLTAFTTTQEGMTVLAWGGLLGFAIGVVASMFVTGWVAGYLGRPYCSSDCYGVLYGFTAWCLALVLAIVLSVPVAKFVSSSSSYLTNHTITLIDYTSQKPATVALSDTKKPAPVVNVNTEKAANDVGKAGIGLFVLFFLGALSSCLGGYFGMEHRNRCCSSTPKAGS